MTALAPGDRVGSKYRVVKLLGEGGMGAVYEAIDEKLQRPVALKVLTDASPSVAERFRREAIAASRARHPGVVEVFDADEHEGRAYLAMERLEGESLRARIERGPLPLDEAVGVAAEALAALEHVHAQGILHRDLKPENVFLARLPDGSRRVKLLDFGIARDVSPDAHRLTQTGMTIGTPGYLAPEQAAGRADLDARVDVYAMGVVLYEMLAGRRPYRAESLGEVVRLMYTTGPEPLAAPGVPVAVRALVETALAVEREHRVPSAAAFRRALVEATRERAELGGADTAHATPAIAAAPGPTVPARRAPPSPPPAPSPPPSTAASGSSAVGRALGGLAALAAVGAAIGALYWLPTRASPTPSAPAPAPAPPAEVRRPEALAGDPNEHIRATVSANGAPIVRCYEEAYPPPREEVVLGVQVVLTAHGAPSAVRTSGGSDALRACVEREIGRMRFDVGPWDANFPLTLRP